MRLSDGFRALTPVGWGLAMVLAVAAALALGRGLGLSWDPFGLGERRLEAAEARAATAESDAAARRLEAEGAVGQARRVDRHHQHAVSVAVATNSAETEARNAHDASVPLDPARAARLREHDRRLCDLAPSACSPAPDGSAPGGDSPVPAGPAA